MKMTPQAKVAIVETGICNTASVRSALLRAGAEPVSLSSADEALNAPYLVLPGVGSFGQAMARLEEQHLLDALRERLRLRLPTLAICLGLQLLCAASEESPNVPGLALLPNTVRRFSKSLRVPHCGWNRVLGPKNASWINGYAYFANSYRLSNIPPGFNGAISNYGEPFVAALWSGGLLACQFHPELSGTWGLDLIRQWLFSELEEGFRCSA